MREDVYLHFKWTPRTTRIAVLSFIAIPTALYYATAKTDAKWSWSGKRKGESLAGQ
jgi:hypothetical protein